MYDPNKPRILVALGGKSAEREISISTGKSVTFALEKLGYPVSAIDIATGRFIQVPELETLEKDPKKMPEVVNLPLVDIKRHFSLVFIAMHGKFGEDGGLQALLEEMGMKYVGSGPVASALAVNKKFSKEIFKAEGVPVLEHQIITKPDEKVNMKLPVVVKPNDQGSSFGVSICENEADLKIGIESAFKYSKEVMIEPYVKGKELTAAILDDDNGEAKPLPVTEIIPKERFFSYIAKYDGTTEEIAPARISTDLTKRAQELALKAHLALGCRHLSRVDMMVDTSGKIFVLELNNIPGLTAESLFPKAEKAVGKTFEQLIDHLVKIALR